MACESTIHDPSYLKVLAIDAGATKVSGAIVDKINKDTFNLDESAIEIQYRDHPNFNASFKTTNLKDQYQNIKISDLAEKYFFILSLHFN